MKKEETKKSESIEIPLELKTLMKNANMSEKEMKNILIESEIKFYGRKYDIIKKFISSNNCIEIENRYLFLKKYYLSDKNSNVFINMSHKYIYENISPKLDLEINNNQIKKWIEDIKIFGKNELKLFSYSLPICENYEEIVDKNFIKNYIVKDGIPSISAGFQNAYIDFFNEINKEFIIYLEKIK